MHQEGLKASAIGRITRGMTEAEVTRMQAMTPQEATLSGGGMPPQLNVDQMQKEVIKTAKGLMPSFTKEGTKSEYMPIWDKAWDIVIKRKQEEVKAWRDAQPATEDEATEEGALEDIKSSSKLTTAINTTVSSFGHDYNKWTPENLERFNTEIIPQIRRSLDLRNSFNEFKSTKDIINAVDELVPEALGEGAKEDIYREAIGTYWMDKVQRKADNREFNKKAWPVLGREPESLEEWRDALLKNKTSFGVKQQLKEIEKRIKERDALMSLDVKK
jgi:hypothetical protein